MSGRLTSGGPRSMGCFLPDLARLWWLVTANLRSISAERNGMQAWSNAAVF